LALSLLDALSDLIRPRRPLPADGPAIESGPPNVSMISSSTSGSEPPAAAGEVTAGPEAEDEGGPSPREAQAMLQLSNVSHGLNHFQNQMMAMLYPSIMAELGMTNMEVGMLSAVRGLTNSVSQGLYGFVTPFVSRCKILAWGNFGIAIGTFMSAMAGSYPMMVLARSVAGTGSSAQHPVGYSILASYFPKSRGSVIAINTSASNVGTLLATPIATAMLLIMGWREIFYIVAFLSVIMGVIYILFKDYGAPDRSGSRSSRMMAGFKSYGRVIKNRNMMIIALVFMVGAAGSEGGINQTYFAPHLTNDFGYGALVVGILMTAIGVGNVGGPILFGWLSDRMNRVHVLQTSLMLSIGSTLWVAWIGPGEVVLFISLLIYSAVTSSRGTLTQAIVADEVGDQDRDAAFSLYFLLGFISQPFWVLLTGFLMDTQGWGIAVSRLSVSYLAGIVLLFFIRDFAASANRPRSSTS
jgi:predicted MFS family arabinose efflux permease